jgi:transcription initiation factor TFIIIB Brf1 subunit/transcription initiation factor TFIIB
LRDRRRSAIVLSLATQQRQRRSSEAKEDGVDELNETLDNLASLLQRTQRFVTKQAAIFKNQQSISVGV